MIEEQYDVKRSKWRANLVKVEIAARYNKNIASPFLDNRFVPLVTFEQATCSRRRLILWILISRFPSFDVKSKSQWNSFYALVTWDYTWMWA